MNSLVDTHAFIWWITADARLAAAAKAAIEERLTGDRLFLSVASAWEIAIKVGEGRLTLPINPGELLAFAERRDFVVLGMKAAHIQAVADLPQFPTHRDPSTGCSLPRLRSKVCASSRSTRNSPSTTYRYSGNAFLLAGNSSR